MVNREHQVGTGRTLSSYSPRKYFLRRHRGRGLRFLQRDLLLLDDAAHGLHVAYERALQLDPGSCLTDQTQTSCHSLFGQPVRGDSNHCVQSGIRRRGRAHT